jgi:hypothetical protein
VKRLLLWLSLAGASFSAACGGSGSPPPPPPPAGNFSNSTLKGSYAFEMSGTDASGNPGALIARVGSFTADGAGNITAAEEDLFDGTTLNSVSFTGGSYSIQANGKGTLMLNTIQNSGLQLTVILNSSTKGIMIQTDLSATSSGNFILQSTSSFVQATINGSYAFDVSGMDASTGAPVSVVGHMVTNGAGAISSGIYDSDDGGTLNAAQTFTAGSYTAPDATFGRGTMTFASRNFVYYIVDNTRIRLIETDQLLFTSGDALLQTNVPTSVAAGNFVFVIGGSSVLGTAGPVARGGRFSTDASGNLTGISVDDNNDGSASTTTNFNPGATFAIDAANSGTGRGTITFTASGQQNPFNAVFYLASPTDGVIQDTSMGIVGDGSIVAQTGPFSGSGFTGNYVVSWSGQNLALGFEEDFAGQYALSSANAVSGVVDFTELATSSNRNPLFSNIELTGNFGLNGDGTQSNTYTLTTNSSPNTTYNFAVYIGGTASAPTILLIDVDSHHVDAGNASFQTQ